MKEPKNRISWIKQISYYIKSRISVSGSIYVEGKKKTQAEMLKEPSRTVIINYLLSLFDRETSYLEIGVRNPATNFNHIKASNKYSVDPGIEYIENPVDYKMTSDSFFEKLAKDEILSSATRFDVIFIDGLHLAEQVNKDIIHSMDYIKEDGFIVLHDCNPPTEWHTRENHSYTDSPAGSFWNGTSWKAFLKWRSDPSVNSCCIDTNWGLGILSKSHPIGKSIEPSNIFYEFDLLEENRTEYLNLISFEDLKKIFDV